METIKSSDLAVATKMIGCTPSDLRAIADSLERAASTAIPGSTVTFPITHSVTLLFRVPEFKYKNVMSDMRDSHRPFNEVEIGSHTN